MNDLADRRAKKNKIALAILSGVLLSAAFPPVPMGVTVLVAFIPFFLLLERLERYGEACRYVYVLLFIWHAIVGYWSGGFSHLRDLYQTAGGVALLVFNPFFYLLPVLVYLFIRRNLSKNAALISFPFLWISIELFRAHTEFALPWITLGNTQTYDLPLIQFASVTGVYGVSFWILLINLILFLLYQKITSGTWRIRSIKSLTSILLVVLLYIIPVIYGASVLHESEGSSGGQTIRVALVQPDIDPFEKWTKDPEIPFQTHLDMTKGISKDIDLVIWSETAIPFYLLHPTNRYYYDFLKQQIDEQQRTLLSGVPGMEFFPDSSPAPKTSKKNKNGQRYDTYNSAMLFTHDSDSIQKYGKHLLVPFAERVPYSEELSFLNAMQWNFGLGGWGIGKEQTVFHFRTTQGIDARFSTMICFESIFPGFVAEFVRNGAQFLTIVTIDSWWGNTSGAYQHKQYAVLRAIENRRWIARCATGGISCIIDPYGRTVESTELFTKTVLTGSIGLRDDLTVYSKYGDWFAEYCLWISLMVVAAGISKKMYTSIRKRQGEENELH